MKISNRAHSEKKHQTKSKQTCDPINGVDPETTINCIPKNTLRRKTVVMMHYCCHQVTAKNIKAKDSIFAYYRNLSQMLEHYQKSKNCSIYSEHLITPRD